MHAQLSIARVRDRSQPLPLARVGSRVAIGLPIIVAVTLATFILLYGIGDPAAVIAGEGASRADIATVRHEFGLDRPLLVQYVAWVVGVAHANLGPSFEFGHRPVSALLAEQLPTTLWLILGAFAIAIPFALLAGFVAGMRPNGILDGSIRSFALLGIAIPPVLLALFLSVLFGVRLRWLPPAGYSSVDQGWGQWLSHMALPWLTLALGLMAQEVRTLRASLLKEMDADYVRTARAKDIPERTIVYRHVGRNAVLPLITVVGLQVPRLITGAVFVESVFGLPGVGGLLVNAVKGQDFPVVQAIVLIVASTVLLANLTVDLLYESLQPVTKAVG